jgi:hypothetical protein
MEVNLLTHILFTLFCNAILFLLGFYCLEKKELVFFTVLAMTVKALLIYGVFQVPSLFASNFFVDSKAYFQATDKTANFIGRDLALPGFTTYSSWDTDVNYIYALINAACYLLFPSASTGFLLNGFFYLLALLVFYRTFFKNYNSRFKELIFLVLLFWPSLFFNSLLFIRDGLIVLLIILFLAAFSKRRTAEGVLGMLFCLVLVANIRWYVGFSLLLFVVGYWTLNVYQWNKFVFLLLVIGFLGVLGAAISYLGFTPETIQAFRNVLTGLEGDYNANSVYLKGYIIDSYPKLLLFIPIAIFAFMFFPLVPLDANPLSLIACLENIFLLSMAVYAWWPSKKVRPEPLPQLQHALLFSLPLLLVYAFGVADSGTAIRQKGFLIFIIVFAFFKKLEWKVDASRS